MNDEQFEKELTSLYQQRKSQTVAPTVTFSEPSVKPKYSVFKLFSIFAVGGVASFGIMAIVTHLATRPENDRQAFHANHQVEITDISPKNTGKDIIIPKPVLPPKPETLDIQNNHTFLKPDHENTPVTNVEHLSVKMIQVVELPQLKDHVLTIAPVYKVMPTYAYSAMKEQQSGSIQLSYEIDSLGNVKNIDIVNSEVNRDLQRSAKKALAQWKYNPKENVKSSYEIIFEFNPIK